MRGMVLVVLGLIVFSSCSKRKASAHGYAYLGERLRIRQQDRVILDTTLAGGDQGNGTCYFERFFYLPEKVLDNVLRVEIDSNEMIVLDTTITFRKGDKDPYLFIYSPLETFWKRRLIAGDGSTEIKL